MSTISCSAPGCESAIYVKMRGLCRPHYNRFMVYGDLDIQPADANCKQCGNPVERKRASGPRPDYCTSKCRNDAGYARIRDDRNAKKREETKDRLSGIAGNCPQCGSNFSPKKTVNQRFCSKSCGAKFHRDASGKTCSAGDCDRPLRARGMCSMHWKRWAYKEGMIKPDPWSDRRKANYQKRRALKLALPAENISIESVYERDGWMCSICDLPVDRNIAWPDPMSPSLDHVKPLSKGGHHVMENVALAHLTCNVRKGDRVEADLVFKSPKG